MSDRGEYRSFYVAMGDDPDIHALSGAAFKLLVMLKFSLGPAGIGVVYPSKLCDQVGVDREHLERLFVELEAPKSADHHGWVMRERNVVWLINGLAFEPNFSPANAKKHVPYIRSLVAQLNGHLEIVQHFKARYPEWFLTEKPPEKPPAKGNRNPTDTLSHHPQKRDTQSHRVSKHKTKQDKTKQSGDLGKERGATPSAAASAPLREALANLPGDAIAFLKRYYPRGKTVTSRRVDVAEQIIATLANGTALRNGQVVRAYSPERLAAKCREVMHAGVRDPDKAIVVLLAKLGDTSDDSAPGVGEARAIGVEQKRAEREATGELLQALSWLEDRPDVVDSITAELEQMGLDPLTCDEDLKGELLVINRRITRSALILAAWREAGTPVLASVPDG